MLSLKYIFSLVLIGFMGFTGSSHARDTDWDWVILAEPYFGLKTGTATQERVGRILNETLSNQAWDTDSPSFGLRFGIRGYHYFFTEFDFSYARTDFDTTAGDLKSATFDNTKFGIVLGAHFPLKTELRGWFGYQFVDNLSHSNFDQTFYGSSTKFGIGYNVSQFLPFNFSVNFEYIKGTYTNYTLKGVEYDLPRDIVVGASEKEVKTSTYFFSISAPFELELVTSPY